jgi:hypothetical protein
MTVELAVRADGLPECGGVEVEYVDPGPGRERRPLAVCWSSRFKGVSPVRGFASFRGQRNWPGWWWFSRTGEHVGCESWVERDVLMTLDADLGVEAVASHPMWLHWVSESGKARHHAPDFFVRRADGTGRLIDVRPDDRISAADSAVFAATAVMAEQAGWSYDRVGRLRIPPASSGFAASGLQIGLQNSRLICGSCTFPSPSWLLLAWLPVAHQAWHCRALALVRPSTGRRPRPVQPRPLPPPESDCCRT